VDFGGESYLAANVYMSSVEEEEEDGGCGLDKDWMSVGGGGRRKVFYSKRQKRRGHKKNGGGVNAVDVVVMAVDEERWRRRCNLSEKRILARHGPGRPMFNTYMHIYKHTHTHLQTHSPSHTHKYTFTNTLFTIWGHMQSDGGAKQCSMWYNFHRQDCLGREGKARTHRRYTYCIFSSSINHHFLDECQVYTHARTSCE
jgi:hypothetical protein